MGTRMKDYEAKTNIKLDPTLPFIIRLDGHTFSSFTHPFKKPGDVRIHNAMVATMVALVDKFKAATGFTCSDEITLVFPYHPPEVPDKPPQLDFDGKVQKLGTLSAGYASMCFHKFLIREPYEANEQHLLQHIEKAGPHFDSRVFNVPSHAELVNNLMWRSLHDFRRNSISSLAQCHFSQKALNGKNTDQQLEMLLEKGVDWNLQPAWYKYGTFAKKVKFEKESTLPDGKVVTAVRTRIETRDIEMNKTYTKEQEDWVTSKYWPEPTPSKTDPEVKSTQQ
uniref:tRNAHis guanylyltransferase catalytic domain-containing protein n=1 Tax=Arcella intermedia TaxID=1963864 RepID=A0A6B2LCK8_9EUKA